MWTRSAGILLLVLLVGAGIYFAFRETPVLADFAKVTRGRLEVTIDEEGVARIRDVYTLYPPIVGHLDRIELDEGDPVVANKTIVASIHPLDPPLLDDRARREAFAAVEAANAAVRLAEVEFQQAQTELDFASSEFDRVSRLAEKDFVSQSSLEHASSDVELKRAKLKSAEANIRLRQAQLESARVRLSPPATAGAANDRPQTAVETERGEDCCIHLRAPVSGVILKILERSEQPVDLKTGIAEIGDPEKIEIAVDVLSEDAVALRPGAAATIHNWGGEGILSATIRRIDPSAFTKVSALGIEEQRVNVLLDLERVPQGLGHEYSVIVRLVVWAQDNVLQIPIGALFRREGQWSTFAVKDGKAVLRKLEIGEMSTTHARVISGLEEGDDVVMFPSDLLNDGGAVEQRTDIR
jgi:HlyD family secretion protein